MSSIRNRKGVWGMAGMYFMILLGSAIYAVGFQFFMYPNSITAGGVVGISMILNQLMGLPVGIMTIVINIPLFLLAWRHFGPGFMIGSFVGMTLSSVFVDVFALTGVALTGDPMLGAIIGGVIKGAGLGCVYYFGATTGGVDILAKLLRRRYAYINFGTLILLIDTAVIAAYAVILHKYESAMYSIICMFVTGRVIDLVLYGIDNSSVCYIISDRSRDITDNIISGHLHRGVTILNATGAYSGEHRDVIMCVIKRPQITELKRVVKGIDERAFVIVTDAKNVFGNGFESISEVR
ncbi:MAG: YitT family protein [Candidatus Limivicinus sp.]|nr:YitT family protein [Candidatus Limivicinus sp.]